MVEAIQAGTRDAVSHMERWNVRVAEGVTEARGAEACLGRISNGAAQVAARVGEIHSALGTQSDAARQAEAGIAMLSMAAGEGQAATCNLAGDADRLAAIARDLQK
jgi:methyl-accepting chemotaxis protein